MISQLIYWTLVGWCGTVPRRFPFPPLPIPYPWPWWRTVIFAIVGGIAGGYLVSAGLGYDELVATSFGAFAGGRIISEIGGSMMNPKKA